MLHTSPELHRRGYLAVILGLQGAALAHLPAEAGTPYVAVPMDRYCVLRCVPALARSIAACAAEVVVAFDERALRIAGLPWRLVRRLPAVAWYCGLQHSLKRMPYCSLVVAPVLGPAVVKAEALVPDLLAAAIAPSLCRSFHMVWTPYRSRPRTHPDDVPNRVRHLPTWWR